MPPASRPRPFTAELQLAGRQARLPALPVEPVAAEPATGVRCSLDDVMAAVRALDEKVSALPKAEDVQGRMMSEAADILGRIQNTKVEIAALRHPKAKDDKINRAAMQLDAIVEHTEQATSTILEAAEQLEGKVADIRAHGEDEFIAQKLDEMTDIITRVYEASNFQDVTGQRIRKVVATLTFIETRIDAMLKVWGEQSFAELPVPEAEEREDDGVALSGPVLEQAASVSQDDIDKLFG